MKKTHARFYFAVALCALLCLCFLFGCKPTDGTTDNSTAVTTVPETEAPAVELDIISGGATDYVFVYPSKMSNSAYDEVLDFYRAKKDSNDSDDGYLNIEDKYPQMVSIITQAYTPFGGKTIDVSKIDNANDFYSKNVQRIKEKIELTYDKSISSKEKQEVLDKAANIDRPYNLEFMNQWPILIKSLLFVYIVIVLSAILISSGLFSFEKENNMDIILNSAGKKKIINIGVNKIFALLSYLTVEFLICTGITSLIIFFNEYVLLIS